MKKFACIICGHQEERTAPPEKCIVCGQGADKFLDNSALFELGMACNKEGNLKGAVVWWKKSANAGNRTAAVNLVLLHWNDRFGMPDKQEFLHWFKKLAYDFKDGWGQAQLGIIYCGEIHGQWAESLGGREAFVSELNPDEGLRLLNEGVPLAEEKGNPKLDWQDYDHIHASYLRYNVKAYDGAEGFSKVHERQNLEKALLYLRKGHEAHLGTTFAPEHHKLVQKSRELDLKKIDILEQELEGRIDRLTAHQKWVAASKEYFSAIGVPGYS